MSVSVTITLSSPLQQLHAISLSVSSAPNTPGIVLQDPSAMRVILLFNSVPLQLACTGSSHGPLSMPSAYDDHPPPVPCGRTDEAHASRCPRHFILRKATHKCACVNGTVTQQSECQDGVLSRPKRWAIFATLGTEKSIHPAHIIKPRRTRSHRDADNTSTGAPKTSSAQPNQKARVGRTSRQLHK